MPVAGASCFVTGFRLRGFDLQVVDLGQFDQAGVVVAGDFGGAVAKGFLSLIEAEHGGHIRAKLLSQDVAWFAIVDAL